MESLSAAVRQLELERNEVQSQLHESQALSQALRDKLENIQHDLASQGVQSQNDNEKLLLLLSFLLLQVE